MTRHTASDCINSFTNLQELHYTFTLVGYDNKNDRIDWIVMAYGARL
jgi:hypothetical protein